MAMKNTKLQQHYFTVDTAKTQLTRTEIALLQQTFERALRKIGIEGDVNYRGTLTSPSQIWVEE